MNIRFDLCSSSCSHCKCRDERMEAESTTAFLAEFMDIFLEEGSELKMILSMFSVSPKKLLTSQLLS